jgi:hypothetical protein
MIVLTSPYPLQTVSSKIYDSLFGEGFYFLEGLAPLYDSLLNYRRASFQPVCIGLGMSGCQGDLNIINIVSALIEDNADVW